jgi:hypothetical protein
MHGEKIQCETRLRLGHLTHADVDGAIKITKLAERNQDVDKFTMTGASRVDKDFILALRGSDISAIRANSALSKKFQDEFQSKVWFVEAEATDKRFIENLFFPAKVRTVTVNMVWLPDGSKLTKAIISTTNKFESQANIGISILLLEVLIALLLEDLLPQITSGNIYNVKIIIAKRNMPMIKAKAMDAITYYNNNYIFLS